MPQKAILIPYTEDQNAPSFPLKGVYTLPDDKKERDDMLREVFLEWVYDEEPTYIKDAISEEFDIIVRHDHGVYLYVIFLDC